MNNKISHMFLKAIEDYLTLYSLLCPLDSSSFLTIEFAIAYIEKSFPGLEIKELRTLWKKSSKEIDFKDFLLENSNFLKRLDSEDKGCKFITELRNFFKTAKKDVIVYIPEITEKLFPYINLNERELLNLKEIRKMRKIG
ncbi:hypothetical protein [Thermodesulfobium sp.]|uniref:Uncharacterized protein n=1 Tax=Thermodesulfobium narugense TaxID=184064 RepID=A0A7C5PGL3_9BACT